MKSDFVIENVNVSNHFIKRYQERFDKTLKSLSGLLVCIFTEFKYALINRDTFNVNFNGVRLVVRSGVLITIISED